MLPKRLNLLLLCAVLSITQLLAQENSPVKFGRVSPSDFKLPPNIPDSSADAIVIADIGSSEFEGNTKGWFSILFRHTKRIKILNKNGFDASVVNIYLFSDGGAEERMDKLKAVTYNLEDGKVVETRLDDKSVFKNVLSKNVVQKKFTMPAVKEGSIIEYSYTISSDFLNHLRPWEFQGEYPCLWSEYEVAMPFFFNYVFLSQGYHPMHIKKQTSSFRTWNVREPGNTAFASTDTYNFSGNVVYNRWVMKDVMPLKEENYTSTLKNHISKIEFQLSEYRFPNNPVVAKMSNWVKVNEEWMKYEEFGGTLDKNNGWMSEELKGVTAAAQAPLAKAHSIYAFVRDQFTCTDHSALGIQSSLKNIMKVKNGNVAELNLLLCALLKHEKIEANPVIVGTRSHGYTHEFYPLTDRFNYVICEVTVDGKRYYLDASQSNLGFGKLPMECYNGHARVLGASCRPVYFEPDSLCEKKVTTVFIINQEKAGTLAGNFNSMGGDFESIRIREQLKDKGKDVFFKEITATADNSLHIENAGIDSLKSLDEPVTVHYDFKLDMDEDVIYFNPLLNEGYTENLFKATTRKYSVEMPYTFDKVYVLNMEIPAGYEVEEMPKSSRISFNDKEGYFEYLIQKDAERIQLRSRVIIRKAFFMPEEYEPLREFFSHVVKKHSEQLVFKKKKV